MFQAGLPAFCDYQVNGFGAHEFDIGAGGVEMRVVGNDIALFAGDAEQNSLRGASLMRGNHVAIAEDVLNRIAEAIKALAAGVTFVAFHDSRPLMRGHGAGAGIGEQVDQHIISWKQEQIVMCGSQKLLAFLRAWSSGCGSTLLMRKAR